MVLFFHFKDAWKMMNVNVLSVTMVRDSVSHTDRKHACVINKSTLLGWDNR